MVLYVFYMRLSAYMKKNMSLILCYIYMLYVGTLIVVSQKTEDRNKQGCIISSSSLLSSLEYWSHRQYKELCLYDFLNIKVLILSERRPGVSVCAFLCVYVCHCIMQVLGCIYIFFKHRGVHPPAVADGVEESTATGTTGVTARDMRGAALHQAAAATCRGREARLIFLKQNKKGKLIPLIPLDEKTPIQIYSHRDAHVHCQLPEKFCQTLVILSIYKHVLLKG